MKIQIEMTWKGRETGDDTENQNNKEPLFFEDIDLDAYLQQRLQIVEDLKQHLPSSLLNENEVEECPVPPLAPDGVTLAENVEKIQREVEDHPAPEWTYVPAFDVLYENVRNKGPMDFKQQGSEYEDFGNFNFGVVGRSAGISEAILKRGAGWAQHRAGTNKEKDGHYLGGAPYGDDPEDQAQIDAGIRYHDLGCLELEEKNEENTDQQEIPSDQQPLPAPNGM